MKKLFAKGIGRRRAIIPLYFLASVIVLTVAWVIDTDRNAPYSATSFTCLFLLLSLLHSNLSSTSSKLGFTCCGSFLLLCQIAQVALLYYVLLSSDASLSISNCGKSSCSPDVLQNGLPYNPNGWSGGKMLCPFRDCRWADVTGEAPNVYPAVPDDPTVPDVSQSPCNGQAGCANLLTTRKEDYPDWGRGLMFGWVSGVTLDDGMTVCPKVDATGYVPETGLKGKGLPVCAMCSAYLYKWHGYTDWGGPLECPGNADDPLCSVCAYTWKQTYGERVQTIILYSFSFSLNVVLVGTRCLLKTKPNKK